MKMIKNKRHFIVGLISTAVAITCLIVWLTVERETRFLIAFALSFIYAIINYFSSFSKKGLVEELSTTTDERDIYIISKTCHTSMKILNYLLFTGCIISLILYVALHSQTYIVIAITLCIILLLMLLIIIAVNNYYEKNN